MTKLEKLLSGVLWMDYKNMEISLEFALRPEYPSDYQQYFGATPCYGMKFDTILYRKKFAELSTYFIDNGFVPMSGGASSVKLINFERKIVLIADISENTPTKQEVDEDDGRSYRVSSDNEVYLYFFPDLSNKEFVKNILEKLTKKFLKKEVFEINRFFMVAQNQRGLYAQKTAFKAIPIVGDRYDLFYGKDFPLEKLKGFFEEKTAGNLMILHGDPGTGKSNFIKHLINTTNRKVIYIPPSMVSVISSPSFITFMLENVGSVLLVEDAEEIISADRNTATNNLLNVCDGFLKDSMRCKVICTCNTDLNKLDKALLRKGRLYFEHHFRKLTIDESRELINYLDIDMEINKEMSLAEIFNPESNSNENSFEDRRMGFLV